MSLDFSLYDDAALEALAPKGVVRRARRDFDAGLGAVKECDARAAVVDADSETVKIDARGPKAAHCTCPATGICRHILLAVMTLNAAITPRENTEGPDAAPSAADELLALSQADLQTFAGADWTIAISLAASSAASSVQQNGRNCTVELEDSPASVTFLAGLGLKGAAFKGPKTRARAIVTAAALIVRQKHGLAVDTVPTEDAAPAASMSRDYLDDAARKIVQSTRMVLAGASPVAADTLFDLAISARAEAAPRLTAQLRLLTKQAGQAAARMVQFEPEAFFADAARAYALIEALKRDAQDPALTGLVRRDFQPAPPLELWMLGAARWASPSGARGLTLHGFAPADQQWRSLTLARGPGMDPAFDPAIVYTMPLWSAGPAQTLMAKTLYLPEPLIAADGAIAPALQQPATVQGAIASTRALTPAGAALVSWAQVRADITARLGAGLRRRTTPIAVLIAPARLGAASFDEFTQNYELEALDATGDALRLTFLADAHQTVQRLSATHRPPLMLAETTNDADRPSLRPISILHDAAHGRLDVVNLTLDSWPLARSAADTLANILPKPATAPRLGRDPLADLARRALETATAHCAGGAATDLAQLESQCDAAGLSALAQSLRHLDQQRTPLAALAAAYLASETLTQLSWA